MNNPLLGDVEIDLHINATISDNKTVWLKLAKNEQKANCFFVRLIAL